ncbi:uncharacterized protein [Nicotiana tomentosiformis]|uniref:uncharacterized protein n=1 Tax=Nicotiana tomentosiformis TaxID=4098 RepID=UPI00388CE326
MGSLAYLTVSERPLAMDVQSLANRFVRLDVSEPSRVVPCVVAKLSLLERIEARQFDDPHSLVLRDTVQRGGAKEVVIREDGVLLLQGRICVPNIDGLRELSHEEAHNYIKLGHFQRKNLQPVNAATVAFSLYFLDEQLDSALKHRRIVTR